MKTYVIVITALLCGVALADSRNFYFAPSGGAGIAVTNRTGGLATTGWTVQPICNVANVINPPVTNGPHYVDTANGDQYYDGVGGNQTNVMGYENNSGTGLIGDGEGSWAAFMLGSGYGYIRFFSDVTVTGAAYYDDSGIHSLTLDGGPDIYDSVVVISNVNPAYRIEFTEAPHTSQPQRITGKVAHIGAGANELDHGVVRVRIVGGIVNTNVAIGADGIFAYDVNDAETFMVQAYVPNASTRPGFPISAEYLVETLPEPAVAVLGGVAVLAVLRRRA